MRLGRQCSFTPDERVKKRPASRSEDGHHYGAQSQATPSLLGWGLRYAAASTPVTLPPQLFPWKDIRLHRMVRRRGDPPQPASHVVQDIDGYVVARGSDDMACIRHLWDVTMASAIERADVDIEGSEAEDGGSGLKRRRQGLDSGWGRPLALASAVPDTTNLQEISTLAGVLNDTVPSYVCIFAPGPSFALSRLTCNEPALALFGWSQAEVDLRVEAGLPLRWLHPEDVLARRCAGTAHARWSLTAAVSRISHTAALSPLTRGVSLLTSTHTRAASSIGRCGGGGACVGCGFVPAHHVRVALQAGPPALLPTLRSAVSVVAAALACRKPKYEGLPAISPGAPAAASASAATVTARYGFSRRNDLEAVVDEACDDDDVVTGEHA